MGGLESSQSGINREVESMVTHAGTQYIVCTLHTVYRTGSGRKDGY